MRVLVTGGCGFIGSHLVDRLVADGHRVTVLDDLSSGNRANLHAEATLVEGDVAMPETVQALVAEADAVFHLAAVASVDQCTNDWLNSHWTNLTGTVTVLEAAAKSGRGVPVIYASSAAVYGDNSDLPLHETAATNPLSAYGLDKLSCERYARIAWDFYKLPSVGLRFFNVFGPRQDARSPYSGVISKFMDNALAGEPLTFFGDGEQTRDFIYVGDIVELLVQAWKNAEGCQVFNGCTGQRTSLKALAEAIGRATGHAVSTRHAEPRAGDIRHSLGSPASAQTTLHFNASTGLEEGLKQLYAWATQMGGSTGG